MIFNFRKNKFFWKYIELNEFREYLFNPDLKVLENNSRMCNFLDKFKFDNKNNYCRKEAKYLFDHLIMSRTIPSTFSTRLNTIINCGEFDSL